MANKFFEQIFSFLEGGGWHPAEISAYLELYGIRGQTIKTWQMIQLCNDQILVIVEVVETDLKKTTNNMCFSCAHAEEVDKSHHSRQPLTCDNRASDRYRQCVNCEDVCSHYWPSSQHEEEPE